MTSLFEKEQLTFNRNKKKWLNMKMEGLIVIIKGNRILGYAGTLEQAYAKGLELLGNQAMFLKKITNE